MEISGAARAEPYYARKPTVSEAIATRCGPAIEPTADEAGVADKTRQVALRWSGLISRRFPDRGFVGASLADARDPSSGEFEWQVGECGLTARHLHLPL